MSSNSEKFVTEDQVRAVREGLTPGRDQKVAVFSLSHGGKSKDPIWTGHLSHIPRVGEQITCTATSTLAGGISSNTSIEGTVRNIRHVLETDTIEIIVL